VDDSEFYPLLHMAAWRYGDRNYARLAQSVSKAFERERYQVLYPLLVY
jgi:hypothetical protein